MGIQKTRKGTKAILIYLRHKSFIMAEIEKKTEVDVNGQPAVEAEQVQDLLKRCGYAPLYAKNRRDSVILYGFYHKQPLFAVNEALYELDEPLLA